MLTWCVDAGVGWRFAPDKPMQNGLAESFNGQMPDEFSDEPLFYDLEDPRIKIAIRRSDI